MLSIGIGDAAILSEADYVLRILQKFPTIFDHNNSIVMNQEYILPNEWSIIEEGFDKALVKSSESLFSIGMALWAREPILRNYAGKNFSG